MVKAKSGVNWKNSLKEKELAEHLDFNYKGVGQDSAVATVWTVRRSNPGVGEIFRTSPDRFWGPHSLLYNGYGVSLPGVKRPGRGVDHPPHLVSSLKKE